MQRERNRWIQRTAPALVALLWGLTAAAQDPAAPPQVDLDRLLQLPTDMDVKDDTVRHGGATRTEWRALFKEANENVEAARGALEASQAELKEIAAGTDSWKVTAPTGGAPGGGGGSNAPLSYRLREEIRRHREDLDRAERELRELRVEANLAGVPPEWHEPERPDAPPR